MKFHLIGFKETIHQSIVQKCQSDTVITILHIIPTESGRGGEKV